MNDHEYGSENTENREDHDTTEPVDVQNDATSDVESANRGVAAFDKLVDWFIEYDPYEVKSYVENFRARNPDLATDELAERLIGLKAMQNGLIGAATGIPGFLALPITVPTDLLMTWKIQINLALCIAYLYGQDIDDKDSDELKTDIYMILAGKSAKKCLNFLGVEIDSVTRRAVKRYVSRELMSEIWKQIARQIAFTTSRKSAVKMSRMMPLIGGPIGFAYDYAATRSVGAFAHNYYSDTIIDCQVT